jgi:hypothetical protein
MNKGLLAVLAALVVGAGAFMLGNENSASGENI